MTMSNVVTMQVIRLETCLVGGSWCRPIRMPTSSASERVAAEVRAALARRKISTRQLAADLGASQSHTARRVTGKVPFSLDELERVADYLGVPVAELIGHVAA